MNIDILIYQFGLDTSVLNTCRDWRKYSKDVLRAKLSSVNWDIKIDNVQQYWNVFEGLLIGIIDEIVPLTEFSSNVITDSPPKSVKNKINKRNRLLKSFKKKPTQELKQKITDLNCEIRSHFFTRKIYSQKGYFARK